jgi:hypothetical protein
MRASHVLPRQRQLLLEEQQERAGRSISKLGIRGAVFDGGCSVSLSSVSRQTPRHNSTYYHKLLYQVHNHDDPFRPPYVKLNLRQCGYAPSSACVV